MPFTAIHASLVWPLYKYWPGRFDLISLTMGAFIPDIFTPFTLLVFREYYWPLREMTHSLIGAVTIDLAMAMIAVIFIVRPMARWMSKKDKRTAMFAKHDITEARSTATMIFSAMVGTVSHVLLDVPYHAPNPLLYPMGPITIFSDLGDLATARLIMDVALISLLLYMLYKYYLVDLYECAKQNGQ